MPVSKFVLKLAGGKRGLLENSENLCAKKQLVKLTMNAQNGRRLSKDQAIEIKCKKKGKGERSRGWSTEATAPVRALEIRLIAICGGDPSPRMTSYVFLRRLLDSARRRG
jgi:hypothetical protein